MTMSQFDEQLKTLPRYQYRGQLLFDTPLHFVVQPYCSQISFLRFVSPDGTRAVPVPDGVTMHGPDGVIGAYENMFPFIQIGDHELRCRGVQMITLQPQRSRVVCGDYVACVANQ
jgi:hypothetical protein